MGCFELFLLAQKVKGDDHIFITWMCCSDVEVIVSMYFIFLANPFWSGTLHHWSQFYREQRRRLLHWETVWCPQQTWGKRSSFLCAQVVRVVIRIQYESTSMCLQNDSLLVGRCSLLPSEDKWWSKLSIYGTESMTDLTKLSSDIWPNCSEKFRTIHTFFGQWPKGRPYQKPCFLLWIY